MTSPEGITATIELITDNELILRVQGRLISYPRALLKENKKSGDTITLTINQNSSADEEAQYKAMKRVLKELVQ